MINEGRDPSRTFFLRTEDAGFFPLCWDKLSVFWAILPGGVIFIISHRSWISNCVTLIRLSLDWNVAFHFIGVQRAADKISIGCNQM